MSYTHCALSLSHWHVDFVFVLSLIVASLNLQRKVTQTDNACFVLCAWKINIYNKDRKGLKHPGRKEWFREAQGYN